MPSELNALPCTECEWAAAMTSGRAWWIAEWITKAAWLTGRVAVDDLAVMVDEHQVADAHVAEAHAERVDPEVVGALRVADGDVAGDALGEAEPAEDAQRAGELGLAVSTLVGDVVERRRAEHGGAEGRRSDLGSRLVGDRRSLGESHQLTILPSSSASGGTASAGTSNTAR